MFSSKLFEILDGDEEDFAFISIVLADSFGSEERTLETSLRLAGFSHFLSFLLLKR